MFTGIVEEVGHVLTTALGKLSITAGGILQGMKLGDSVDVNGACLTITNLSSGSLSVDVMPETLRRTNLGQLSRGDKVNLERPLTLGGRLGGHLVQGHVDATGKVVALIPEQGAVIMTVEAPPEVMRYVVEKGFIAVDGVSLTIVTKSASSFQVSLVDYTLKHTNLSDKREGGLVNLEIDIIAKYVERLSQPRQGGVTTEFLQEHGFLV